MNFRIEDIRKALSTVATWLTFDDNTRFLKEERNIPTSEHAKELAKQLDILSVQSRKLLNNFSESIEYTDMCRKSLRYAIEREKKMGINRNKEKI